MKRPAFQFYPADWRKDSALQSCSIAARGLWVEMMCIAHECDPYGHLSVNSKPMTTAQLARLVGESERDVVRYLDELESAGVFSRNEQGVIYSRRMTKDERLRNVRAQAGRLGGNPNLLGDKVKQKVNHPPNQEPTPSSSSSSSSSTLGSSAVTQPEVGAPPGNAPPQGEESPPNVLMAVELRKRGVSVTAMHPMVHEWVKAGVTIPQAIEAVAVARMRKADGSIAPNYLAPIIDDIRNPKPKADQWWTSDEGIDRKGRELGIQARPHENYAQFKDRIFAAMRNPQTGQAA